MADNSTDADGVGLDGRGDTAGCGVGLGAGGVAVELEVGLRDGVRLRAGLGVCDGAGVGVVRLAVANGAATVG